MSEIHGKSRDGRLRVAITADPGVPVPPQYYGGIERIVDMLVRELVARGHDITLFAHPASTVSCRLIPYADVSSRSRAASIRNAVLVSTTILRERFDIVHSFGRLGYLLFAIRADVPKLMSYQREVTGRSVAWGDRLSQGTLHFTGCSQRLIERFLANGNWHVVYNGVPSDRYTFRSSVANDAPLMFLGRIEEIKGPHVAIDVARRSGRALLIAGNVPDEPTHRRFFETSIAPYIDGTRITYVGPVDDGAKNDLLGRSAALLMPILWEEPFGIVMAEALACGTPVIGLRRGSVEEVVTHGATGFVCDSADDMVAAVARIGEIDRTGCRRRMEDQFSATAVANAYETLYYRLSRRARLAA